MNSGYSLGTIQVDLGQRGTWPLGTVEARPLTEGEKTYVDAIIEQSHAHAKKHQLPFTNDLEKLRTDLLSHGDGRKSRPSITFIDTDTRDSMNAWASSDEGRKWIHTNIDYPQVRNMTRIAMSILDRTNHSVQEERRFEATNILAKTANQVPGKLGRLENVLNNGAGYDELLAEAKAIQAGLRYYHGPKAASVAQSYENRYGILGAEQSLDRAHAKVGSPDYDPSVEARDVDIQMALRAIGQRPRIHVISDPTIASIQQNLNEIGFTDTRGQPLVVDGIRGGPGSRTNQAIEAFRTQSSLPAERFRDWSPAELLAATEAALDTRQPLRRLDRTIDAFGERFSANTPGSTQKATPRLVNGLPDYLLRGREATPAPLLASQPPRTGDTAPRAPQPAAPAPSPPQPDAELQPGHRGTAVLALQERLRLVGATDRDGRELQADGNYGSRTKDAVEQFQLWTGRETTGIADRDTLQALDAQARFASRQRGAGVAPGRHVADNLMHTPTAPGIAADVVPPQRIATTSSAGTNLPPLHDPQHPQHGLYAELKAVLPDYTSEQRLAQFTAVLHGGGIRQGDLKAIDINADRAMFIAHHEAGISVRLGQERPPSIEDSLQQIEHDRRGQEGTTRQMQAVPAQNPPAVQH
ncbi:peptidoglycan-binding domain-containing protein [Luteimonas marina]|nr:peptidoglycan-binding domain-containing protein [Luteimonas marina]